jgi:hypothetical protein
MGYIGMRVGTPAPGDHIEVYWDGDKRYYGGRVVRKGLRGVCVVRYDDDETREEDLLAMPWRLSPFSSTSTRKRIASYERSWKWADAGLAADAAAAAAAAAAADSTAAAKEAEGADLGFEGGQENETVEASGTLDYAEADAGAGGHAAPKGTRPRTVAVGLADGGKGDAETAEVMRAATAGGRGRTRKRTRRYATHAQADIEDGDTGKGPPNAASAPVAAGAGKTGNDRKGAVSNEEGLGSDPEASRSKRQRVALAESATEDTATADRPPGRGTSNGTGLAASDDQAALSSLSLSDALRTDAARPAGQTDGTVTARKARRFKNAVRAGVNGVLRRGDGVATAFQIEDESKSEKHAGCDAASAVATEDDGRKEVAVDQTNSTDIPDKTELQRKGALSGEAPRSAEQKLTSSERVVEPGARTGEDESGLKNRMDPAQVEEAVRQTVKEHIEKAMTSMQQMVANELSILSDDLLNTVMHSLFQRRH